MQHAGHVASRLSTMSCPVTPCPVVACRVLILPLRCDASGSRGALSKEARVAKCERLSWKAGKKTETGRDCTWNGARGCLMTASEEGRHECRWIDE